MKELPKPVIKRLPDGSWGAFIGFELMAKGATEEEVRNLMATRHRRGAE